MEVYKALDRKDDVRIESLSSTCVCFTQVDDREMEVFDSCLSTPHLFGRIKRYVGVEVTAQRTDGSWFKAEAKVRSVDTFALTSMIRSRTDLLL